MIKFGMIALFCAALFLQGCANGDNPIDSFYRTAAHANPFASDSALGGEGELYLGVVEGLVKQGRDSAALAFLDGYNHSGEELSPRYWLLRGKVLSALGRNNEATDAFSKLLDTPLAASGWNGRGRIAVTERDWETAANDFARAVERDPANPDFLNNLGFAELNLHNADSAVARLQQAHQLDPNSDRVCTNLIIALMLKGDSARADMALADIKDSGHREAIQARAKSAVAMLTTEKKS